MNANEEKLPLVRTYPKYVMVACIAVTLWCAQGLLLNLWAFAQQTLIAQSNANQQLQQAQQREQAIQRELAAERAKGAKAQP